MQAVLQVVGSEVRTVVSEIDDFGQFIQRKEVISLFSNIFLEIVNIVSLEVYPGFFTEENIASAVKGDDVAEDIFPHVFHKKATNMLPERAEFEKFPIQIFFS